MAVGDLADRRRLISGGLLGMENDYGDYGPSLLDRRNTSTKALAYWKKEVIELGAAEETARPLTKEEADIIVGDLSRIWFYTWPLLVLAAYMAAVWGFCVWVK